MQNKNGGKSLYSSDKYSLYSSDTEERVSIELRDFRIGLTVS